MKKSKRKKKGILRNPKTLILLTVTVALAIVAVFLYHSQPDSIDRLQDSYLSTIDEEVIRNNVKTSFNDDYEIQNYSIYGEFLKFYQDKKISDTDDLVGKNVVLKNVETKEEISYTFSTGAENGIKLRQIPEGFYEVYVYDHFVKKRVYFENKVESDKFATMRRNEKVSYVTLEANKDLLESFGVEMNKNYCFLSVLSDIPMVNTIDVIIDPCGNTYDEQANTTDTGLSGSGIEEYSSSYEFAKKIKKQLEKHGLKVELTRKKNEKISYYGKQGRAGKGYEKNAKVFLSLGLMSDGTIERPLVKTSPYTSATLANQIAYDILQSDLEMHNNYQYRSTLTQGVTYDAFEKDDEEKETRYEELPQLRETGGKITYAGRMDSALMNSRYKFNYGMYGIYFQYANILSEDSVNYFYDNEDAYAKAIANGIVHYFDIEGDSSETTTK